MLVCGWYVEEESEEELMKRLRWPWRVGSDTLRPVNTTRRRMPEENENGDWRIDR
jgi:hypothetical protein